VADDCLIFEALRTGDRDRVLELLLAGDATAEHVGLGITPLYDEHIMVSLVGFPDNLGSVTDGLKGWTTFEPGHRLVVKSPCA
jgi:hypothetical protein